MSAIFRQPLTVQEEAAFFFPRTQSAPASIPAANNVKQGGRTGDIRQDFKDEKTVDSPSMLPPTLPASPTVPVSCDGVVMPWYYKPFNGSYVEKTQSAPAKLLSNRGYDARVEVPRSPGDDFFDPGHAMDFHCNPDYY